LTRPQKITFGDMRESGVRGVLIYCSDYRCSHWIAINGDRWPDDLRLSDLEPRFTLGHLFGAETPVAQYGPVSSDAGRDRPLGAKRLADADRAGRGCPPR